MPEDEPTCRTVPLVCGCFYQVIEWPPRPPAVALVAFCEEHRGQVARQESLTDHPPVMAS